MGMSISFTIAAAPVALALTVVTLAPVVSTTPEVLKIKSMVPLVISEELQHLSLVALLPPVHGLLAHSLVNSDSLNHMLSLMSLVPQTMELESNGSTHLSRLL